MYVTTCVTESHFLKIKKMRIYCCSPWWFSSLNIVISSNASNLVLFLYWIKPFIGSCCRYVAWVRICLSLCFNKQKSIEDLESGLRLQCGEPVGLRSHVAHFSIPLDMDSNHSGMLAKAVALRPIEGFSAHKQSCHSLARLWLIRVS